MTSFRVLNCVVYLEDSDERRVGGHWSSWICRHINGFYVCEVSWSGRGLACRDVVGEIVMAAQNIISFHGIEGVDLVEHLASGGVCGGIPEFVVPFCKDEVGAHAASN